MRSRGVSFWRPCKESRKQVTSPEKGSKASLLWKWSWQACNTSLKEHVFCDSRVNLLLLLKPCHCKSNVLLCSNSKNQPDKCLTVRQVPSAACASHRCFVLECEPKGWNRIRKFVQRHVPQQSNLMKRTPAAVQSNPSKFPKGRAKKCQLTQLLPLPKQELFHANGHARKYDQAIRSAQGQ